MSPPSNADIGFSALGNDFSRPDARRRFGHYATRRGIEWTVARPGQADGIVVSTMGGDISEWARLPRPTRLVLDFVDSYLAVPTSDWKGRARGLAKFLMGHTRHLHLDYRGLLVAACRRADAVVCCTEEQRQSILPYCPNVHPILDFQPEAELAHKTSYASTEPFRIVWEGLPQNLEPFRTIVDALREVARRTPIELHLVTDPSRARVSTHLFQEPTEKLARAIFGELAFRLHTWTPETLSAVATASDLAVIPLRLDDPFAAGKSENKLILFWRMGLPVVTSSTRAYRRAMADAALEMTCTTSADWVRVLERLATDESARTAAGHAGREYALREHGEARLLERWDAVMASAGFAR
jgi:glycosyltransferase involved in cell wall biosynthesis